MNAANMVRQPILGPDGEVFAYELLYEDGGASNPGGQDSRVAGMVEDFLLEMDSGRLLDGKKLFVTFTPALLERQAHRMFSPKTLVIQVDDAILAHPMGQSLVEQGSRNGYEIAIRGFEYTSRYFAALDFVQYIKLDMAVGHPSLAKMLQMAKVSGKRVIGYRVNSAELYASVRGYGFAYLQGLAVTQGMYRASSGQQPLQSAFYQLMVALTRDQPNQNEIVDIIACDADLTANLLKLVNSACLALHTPVQDVRQALVVLGVGQLQQWVYLLFCGDTQDQVLRELVKNGLVRGRFCQELGAGVPTLPIGKSAANMLGMLSVLGLLLGVPLEEAVAPLPVSPLIKDALLHEQGVCGKLYKLVGCYVNADFKCVEPLARELGIKKGDISRKYLESAEDVNQIWNDFVRPHMPPPEA